MGRLSISASAALQVILATHRPLRFLHRECAFIDLDPNYSGYPNPRRDKWLKTTGRSLNPCECVTAVSEEFDIRTISLSLPRGGRQELLLAIPDVELLAALEVSLWT